MTDTTGFFYLRDEFLCLVTCRHVVINEATGHRPNRLQLSLHIDTSDLQRTAEGSLPLYVEGISQWYQPSHSYHADGVAVSISDPHALTNHYVITYFGDDILNRAEEMSLGQNVLVVRFPLGFYDTLHGLPIVRSATIASSLAHPLKGELYCSTDARLHRGMSGSPVIVNLPDRQGSGERTRRCWLLGLRASALDVSDRDPDQDERLALNTAWYASLIPEILSSRSKVRAGGGENNGFNN